MNTIKKSLVAASVLAAFGTGAANAATIATFSVNQNVDSILYLGSFELTSPSLPHSGTGTGSLDSNGSITMDTVLHLETTFGTDSITSSTYSIPSLGGSDASSHTYACAPGPNDAMNTCASVLASPDYLNGVTTGALPDGVGDVFTLLFDGGAAGSRTQYSFEITDWTPAAVVPVPAAAWLFGSGLLGLAGAARRRRSTGIAA